MALDSWNLTDDDYKTIESSSQDLKRMVQQMEDQGFRVAAIGDPQSGKIHHVIAQDKNDKLPRVLTDKPLFS